MPAPQPAHADLLDQPRPGDPPPRSAASGPARRPDLPPVQADLVRQVQTALDAAMDRLDVACERFRAVGDAHELRLDRLGKAMDADRSGQSEQVAALQEGAVQLVHRLDAEVTQRQDADRLAASRQRGESERLDAALQRLDRLEQRMGRQRETLDTVTRRLDDLQQAYRQEFRQTRRRLAALTLALALTTLLAFGGVALTLSSRGTF